MGYNPQMRKVYADFNKPNLKPYENIKQHLTFTKIDSQACVSGKNTSDVAMAVGAMDILHKHPSIGCFALVTSDSDFSPLVTRLNQAGKVTIGFGRQQTPTGLVKQYKEFVFIDDQKSQKKAPKLTEKNELIEFLSKRILEKSDKCGWAPLTVLGMAFDCREYGYKTVSKYFDANADRFQLHSSRELVRILLPKDRLDHLANLIVSCHDYYLNWAPVKTLEEKFNARLYGYDGMENLLDDFPELFRQGIDGKVLFVRNKVPRTLIQDLKEVIEIGSEPWEGGYTDFAYVERYFQMDFRRFGYKTLKDFFRDQSEHFLVRKYDDGDCWVKIRS